MRRFLRRTLQRAFHELDGHTAKRGLHQGCWWSLADQSAENHPPKTRQTADIFEDVTFDHDIAAQQQLDKVLTARPPLSHSIATLERLDRRVNGDAPPPSTTGHPILDAILDEFRKLPHTASPQHLIPDTFTLTTP